MRNSKTIATSAIAMALCGLWAAAFGADKTPATPAPPAATRPASIFDFGLEPLPNAEEDKPDKMDARKPVQPKPAPADSSKPAPPTPTKPVQPASVSKSPAPSVPISASGDLTEVLKACHIDANGVLTSDQDVTLGMKGTEGKHFILSGEFYLAPEPTQFNCGGVVFRLRRVDSKKSIDLNVNQMRVKRILLEGNIVKKFATPMKFSPLDREKWLPFKIDAGEQAIAVQFGDQNGIAKGSVATEGTNAITLRPGAKLRHLKLQILDN